MLARTAGELLAGTVERKMDGEVLASTFTKVI
jgi:hypothetical protein